MGRKGITQVDVLQAYIALLKQRRTPGPQNLRLELGRGSYSTIAKHVERLALKNPRYRPPRQKCKHAGANAAVGQETKET